MHCIYGAFAETSKNEHQMWENLKLGFHCTKFMITL
jgi:hypothetical protein